MKKRGDAEEKNGLCVSAFSVVCIMVSHHIVRKRQRHELADAVYDIDTFLSI